MRSIQPTAFEVSPDGGACCLVGGYCASSDRYHFPLQHCCPYSGATDVARVELSDRATLWGWTTVTAAPPGYSGPVPYGFGVVELTQGTGTGLRIVTRIAAGTADAFERLEFGTAMRLAAEPVATRDDGETIVAWTFVPEPA